MLTSVKSQIHCSLVLISVKRTKTSLAKNTCGFVIDELKYWLFWAFLWCLDRYERFYVVSLYSADRNHIESEQNVFIVSRSSRAGDGREFLLSVWCSAAAATSGAPRICQELLPFRPVTFSWVTSPAFNKGTVCSLSFIRLCIKGRLFHCGYVSDPDSDVISDSLSFQGE